MFKLGEAILALLEIVFGFWNSQVSLVFELLGQSPTGFKGGGPWGIVESVEPLFVAIGSSLVVLFFVIGFCSESVDIREEMRFEVILRMFIRVAISQWMVAYNVTIMKALFTSCGNLVGLLGTNQNVELTIDSAQAEIIFPVSEDHGHCTVWSDCKQYHRRKQRNQQYLCQLYEILHQCGI